ncbi:IS3 family transposase [Pseudoalteromonas luteoviolacea]|uniref:IS3 family transposase n=1 Tax=Pseudoalteromonas luteoviolacea TaxID=43657 RepID=UPI00114F4AE3|nr:IS3 family transposase [Pseudoalteromonas luteoviolacea]TQF67866.1 IS3 family transposase [Pseudoalteromonas luteoviolacea]
MRKSKFTETQIVGMIKEAESGVPVPEICRKHGVGQSTFYKWRSKYGGMEASDVKRLKELEDENRKLKDMFATLSLKHSMLEEIIFKKAVKTSRRRAWVAHLRARFEVSVAFACDVAGLSRSVYYYKCNRPSDDDVIDALLALVERHPGWGMPKLFKRLRHQGKVWNKKRVERVYNLLKLNLRRKGKRRVPTRTPKPLSAPGKHNDSWSMDFMSDALNYGHRFRTLNVLDDYNRQALAIEVDTSLTAERVIRVLERVIAWRGTPKQIRVDNGPEFTSNVLESWAAKNSIKLEFIKPGSPYQNGFVERFNRSYREEVLDLYLFESLQQVRDITDEWLDIYNYERPHDALGDQTPMGYLEAA